MSFVLTVLASLGVAYAILLVAATWLSVRPPRVPIFFSPGSVGAPQMAVEFPSGRGHALQGWWVSAEGDVAAVLCHGYLMNRSELSPLAVWLWQQGVSSLVFDFSAHGASGGKSCGFGVSEAEDVAAAVRYVRGRMPGARIALVGSSMGGAACAMALAKDPALADALILDCAYSRLWVASLGWWRFLGGRPLMVLLSPTLVTGWAVSRINPFGVDLTRSLKKLNGKPALLIHGDADTLVPPREAVRNHFALGGSARLVWLEGCGHAEGRWLKPDVYHRAIQTFLADAGLLEPLQDDSASKGPLP